MSEPSATNTLMNFLRHMTYRGPMTMDVSRGNDGQWMATTEWNPREDEPLTGVASGTGATADEAVADMLTYIETRLRAARERRVEIEHEERLDIELGRQDAIDDYRGEVNGAEHLY